METLVWIFQAIVSFIFLFSGLNKAYFDEKTLVQKGQTGVEGLPKYFIKFIGFSEVMGSIGLIAPMLLNRFNFLTPLAALCLGCIMLPASYIHIKRDELRNVLINTAIFMLCLTIAIHRW